MDLFEKVLTKVLMCGKNIKNLYSLNAIYENPTEDLFDKISKVFTHFRNYKKRSKL